MGASGGRELLQAEILGLPYLYLIFSVYNIVDDSSRHTVLWATIVQLIVLVTQLNHINRFGLL